MEVTPAGQADVQSSSTSQQESESSKEVRKEGNSLVESSSSSTRSVQQSVQQSVTQRVMSSSVVKQSSFSSTSVSSSQQNPEPGAAQLNGQPEQPAEQAPCPPWASAPPQPAAGPEEPPAAAAAAPQDAPQPVKDCSDLPQDSIKSSLKEIICDLEKADLADGPADSEVFSSQTFSSSTTETAEERRSKMDRQTSTTTLEQALLKEHTIAHELNMLSRNEESLCKQEIAEEPYINHIPDDDRSRGGPAHIDLERLFTPATDSGESTPRARKNRMYASSSFYGPEHPTVEEQVELARRISTSLSDISNQRSKGQTMYVNRKKRSAGWVHAATDESFSSAPSTPIPDVAPPGPEKPVLKLVMDPRGQVQDLWSLQKQGVPVVGDPKCGALSPEVCFHLVRDLNAPKGKGAELFAKRRKKSEKWVVDETTVRSSSTTSTMESTSPAPKLPVPAASYLSNGSAKVHNVQRMNEIQEKFSQPRLKLVKSPWEAALETGSVDGAFVEGHKVPPSTPAPAPPPRTPAVGTPTWTATTTAATVRPLSATESSLYSARAPRGWGQHSTSQQYGDSALLSFRGPPEEPAPLLLREAQGPAASSGVPASACAPEPPVRTVFMDYSLLQNYNTAPRGWGSTMDYYRPVTFCKPIAATDL